LKYIIVEPAEDEHKRGYKYPFVVSEILCDLPHIIDLFFTFENNIKSNESNTDKLMEIMEITENQFDRSKLRKEISIELDKLQITENNTGENDGKNNQNTNKDNEDSKFNENNTGENHENDGKNTKNTNKDNEDSEFNEKTDTSKQLKEDTDTKNENRVIYP